MRYAEYSSYKETKSPWLETIPEHWEEKRLKDVATYNDESLDEKTDPDFEIEYVDISSVSLTHGIEKTELLDFEKAPSRARRKVKDGDVIVSTVRTYLKAIAPVNNPPPNMVVSTGFAVIRPCSRLDPRFVGYMLQSNGFVGDVVANSVGVSYPAINASDLARLPFVEPPLSEQQKISNFLDQKIAKIDVLLAKKRSLLDKLFEQRTALISRLVTKGLNPKVPTLDSGIDWLGDIPEGWTTCLLKRISDISYGIGGEIDRTKAEGTRLISLPNVTKEGDLDVDETPYCDISDNEKEKVFLKKGDLLFNWRNGSSEHLGKTALFNLDGEWAHVSFLLKIRFDLDKYDSRYFNYLLSGYRYTGFFTSSKAGVNNTFNLAELSNLWVVVPPKSIQHQISDFLDEKLAGLSLKIKKALEVVNKLVEYRSALITNAVTGKIDVRNHEPSSSSSHSETLGF